MSDEELHNLAGAFHYKPKEQVESFYWWSWHPRYPRWSKSCWGAKTAKEAMEKWDSHVGSQLSYYHNKLIEEYKGEFIEIADKPCQRLDVWRKCLEIDKNFDELNKRNRP